MSALLHVCCNFLPYYHQLIISQAISMNNIKPIARIIFQIMPYNSLITFFIFFFLSINNQHCNCHYQHHAYHDADNEPYHINQHNCLLPCNYRNQCMSGNNTDQQNSNSANLSGFHGLYHQIPQIHH